MFSQRIMRKVRIGHGQVGAAILCSSYHAQCLYPADLYQTGYLSTVNLSEFKPRIPVRVHNASKIILYYHVSDKCQYQCRG